MHRISFIRRFIGSLTMSSFARPALRGSVSLMLVCVFAIPARADDETAPDAPPEPEESWQVIEMAGVRVGYAHVAVHNRKAEDGTPLIVTDMFNYMEIKRFNMTLKMTVQQQTEETEDGDLLRFRFKMDNPPISQTLTVGRVDGDTLYLETHANGKVTETTKPWDAEVKSPSWQDRSLKENPLEPGETRSFKMFDPQFNQGVTVTLSEKGRVETELLDGSTVEVQKVAMGHSLIPGFIIDTFVDDEGELIKTETNLLQTVTYTVDRETALEELSDEPLDLAIETLVKVEPIENAYEQNEIVYRITVPGGDAAGHFATGPTQSIREISDTEIELTVRSVRPQGEEARPPSTGDAPDPVFLKPTRFLDCRDPDVARHADKAAGDRTEPAEIAVAMEKYVHSTLDNKNFSTGLATATEVARELEGDCTEHSVLLAAMLRAKDVPSRVVVGLVYSDRHSAFAGHMWTEAYLDGQWIPLDATMGAGGIGAAHIKVTDSSLDEDAPTPVAAFVPMMHLLGQMTIEVVSAE